MTKREIKSAAKEQDWDAVFFPKKNGCVSVEFSTMSEFGQDFSFSVEVDDLDDIPGEVYTYWNLFDASSEAYLWLDEEGHGKNGAPYSMGDVFADFDRLGDRILRLYDKLYDCQQEEYCKCTI